MINEVSSRGDRSCILLVKLIENPLEHQKRIKRKPKEKLSLQEVMVAPRGFLVSFSDKIAYGHFLSSLSCIKHDHQAIHGPKFLTNTLIFLKKFNRKNFIRNNRRIIRIIE